MGMLGRHTRAFLNVAFTFIFMGILPSALAPSAQAAKPDKKLNCLEETLNQITGAPKTSAAATKEITEKVSGLEIELKKIREICGPDEKCHQAEIKKLFTGNVLTKFNSLRCLRGDSQAMKSTLRGLAIANAGMIWQTASQMAKAKREGRDDSVEQHLPIAMLANTWLWTFFLAEIGCQNTLAKKLKEQDTPGPVGAMAPQQIKKSTWNPLNWYTKEDLKTIPRNYWNYLVWSPPNEATFYAFYVLQEKMRGNDIEFFDPKAMAGVIGMGMLYDATWAIPRQVLVLDTVYLRKYPALQVYVDRLVKEKAVSEVVMASGDLAIRSFVSKINTQVNNQYMEWAAKFYAEPQASPTSTPTNATE